MEVRTAKQVRFAKIVEIGGKPETYLPFGEPEKDREFMRAVKEERVLTIKQEPTSKLKDFGIVGFVKEKYATYLLFPKSLRRYAGQRVIGIKYDVVESGGVSTSSAPRKREGRRKEKKQKPEPKPKRFVVRVRVTSVEEKEIEVSAWTHAEARTKAREEVEGANDFASGRMQAKVVGAREVG